MKTVTLSAHLDGPDIKLDEPYEIPSDARLLVTVLPPSGDEVEHAALLAATPPNAQLLDMARNIKPDFSWYPAEDPQP